MRRRNPAYIDPDLEKLDAAAALPEEGAYLLRWFGELSATRGLVPFSKPLPDGRLLSGFRPMALMPSDIESWARQSGIHLAPWEFKILLALDRVYLAAQG